MFSRPGEYLSQRPAPGWMQDRECPVSGGMGSHLILKLLDGKTIEVLGGHQIR